MNLVENSRPVLKRCCPQRDVFPIATATGCLAPGVSLCGVVPGEEKQGPLDSNWRPEGLGWGFPVPLLAGSWEPRPSEGVCGWVLLSERFWGRQGSVG